MNCPNCGKEMEAGYLQAPSMILWDTTLQDGIVYFSEHGFYLARSWIKPSSVKSYHCDNCELLITDLKDVNPKLRK